MNIRFEKVVLHNFLSFGDAELVLSQRGYAVVKGVNNNPKDSAISNGSGKSSIWSAISYALTGETIQGLKSNIVNINGTDGCFVKLFFNVDGNAYEITRYKEYGDVGTDLKIIVNGKDTSGKGIKESQQLLLQYLPDLTTELIGSVIILGQGLPHKFSNHSPSGRKEVLEKLSKSDFMIQDIKDRIESRNTYLLTSKRSMEDTLLGLNSQLSVYTQQYSKITEELSRMNVVVDYDSITTKKQLELDQIDIRHQNCQGRLDSFNKRLNYLNESISQESLKKSEYLANKSKESQKHLEPLKEELTTLNVLIKTLEVEITKLKGIKDTCPTCGQKIPGALKPDTSEKDRHYLEYHNKRDTLISQISSYNTLVENETVEYNKQYDLDTVRIREELSKVKSEINNLQYGPIDGLTQLVDRKLKLSNEITSLHNEKKNFFENKKRLEDRVKEAQTTIESLKTSITSETKSKEELQKHIDVITKMSTLVKRDFRGFLLSSVILFIDKKAKEYSQEVFGTSELNFKLDGNNIDISYCGKTFENLSGGEKQRVDLIIQFAVRDMMSQYLSFTSNIIVLDEIFDNLDIKGTTNVLNLISNKLNDVESIFIISHNESLKIPYDDIITVTKDERGFSKIK
jgi:DNA repair exonuclease SbcCD ATPase subunit